MATVGLKLHRQQLAVQSDGRRVWVTLTENVKWEAAATAILISDMWDRHWSHGATIRTEEMAPKIDAFISRMRNAGVTIIHAPSGTMDFYKESPARLRLLETEQIPVPEYREKLPHIPLPIDDSDGGSDTGEPESEVNRNVWTRQNSQILIDEDRDIVAGDEGDRIYSYLQKHGIRHMLYVGVHTNMCILNRTFGIKRMSDLGIFCTLVRDLTDAMYNPAKRPYVSHEEGTQLVVDYVEKFWCPTVSSDQVAALSEMER